MDFPKPDQIAAIIFNSNKIPNSDIDMHVRAILAGDYTLQELLAHADKFYSMSGYTLECELQLAV